MKRRELVPMMIFLLLALLVFAVQAEAQWTDPVTINQTKYLAATTGIDTVDFSVKLSWVQVFTKDEIVTVELYSNNGSGYVLFSPSATSPDSVTSIPAGSALEFPNLPGLVRVIIKPAAASDVWIYGSESRYQ